MATSAATLIANAKELADLTNSAFVSDAQWLIWVNEGARELHTIVSTAFADTFYTEASFTIAAGANTKDLTSLSPAFMRIKGLDFNPTLPTRETVRRYNFAERNNVGASPLADGYARRNLRRYRVVSRSLLIVEPKENAPGDYKLMYVAVPTVLTNSGTPVGLQAELDPWAEYIEIVSAIKARVKQEKGWEDLRVLRDTMRADIEASAPTDESEGDTIADVESNRVWGGWPR